MVAITYRADLGAGVNLSAAQVDANFLAVSDAIDDLIANPPEANGIESITASGLTYVFTMSDASTFTLPFPFVAQTIRGEWLPSTFYGALDTVTIEGDGVYVAMVPHTAGATFDPDLEIDTVQVWQKEFTFGLGSSSVLNDLSDVALSSPIAGDFLRYDGGSPNGWTNEAGSAISDLPLGSLPVAPLSFLEISETDGGSPATYISKHIRISDLLRAGNATLVAGTVTVTNATVTTNTIVLLSRKTIGGTPGFLSYTVSAGASFTINSASGTDTSAVSYTLVEG